MLGQLLRRTPEDEPVTRIRVRGGYEPSVVRVRACEHVRIAFLRQERARCSERVVFPTLGRNVALPAHEQVVIDLGAARPGEYEFTCQMGVLRGRLIVEGADERSTR